ncbi:MAG: hypothetical protein WCM76_09210 [Bacteroidota bacterium]
MRTVAIIFLTFLVLAGCKKDKYGNLVHKVKFTSSKGQKGKSMTMADDLRYTQFGDYITSLTPTGFKGDLDMIRIFGNTIASDNHAVAMTLILPGSGDNTHFADFSGNAEITVSPTLCGPFVNVNEDGSGGCFKDDAIFKFLQIGLHNIVQVIELPVQYSSVNLSQFLGQYSGDSIQHGTTLNVDMYPLIGKINDTLQFFKQPMTFYFGMIDATTLYSSGPSVPMPSSLNENQDMPVPFVWSNNFSEWTLKSPGNGETITITSTIGFDNENLIQIYAGADNIPYTSDDIIVYAPNFWERIYINVTTD